MARRPRRLIVLVIAAAALAGSIALGQPEPRAAGSRPELRVSPAPLSSKSVFVRWRADHARKRGRTYTMELRIKGASGLCSDSRDWTIRRSWNKGDPVNVRLRPLDMTLGQKSLWCPGNATLRVLSAQQGKPRRTHAVLRFRMPADPASPIPKGTAVELELLEGSTISVQVPGRPDRTSTLTGQLTGQLPGRYDGDVDAVIDLMGGALSVEALEGDPLCMSNRRSSPNAVALAPSGSKSTLFADDRFAATLVLSEDPVVLTGCEGPPAAARSLSLTGRGTGLTRIEASGSFSGVRLSEGVDARIVVNVVVGVEMSVQ